MKAGPIKVLHIIGGLQLGGAETLLYRLASRRWADVAHEIICLGKRDWYSAPLEQAGVTVHHLGTETAVAGLLRVPSLWRLIKASGADVIQSWMYLSNAVAGAFGKAAGIPVVWGIHASGFDHLSRSSRLAAHAAGRASRGIADFVINCSTRSAEFHQQFGYSAVPGAVIHNGYDPAAYFPDEGARVRARAALGIAADTFVIGSVARWHPQKDVPNLIAALSLVRQRGLPVECLLIGRELDPANGQLVALVRDAGVADAVQLLGPRADTADLARALDLHVLSSNREAFPNVVAETMLSGTPNVVTDVGDAALMARATGWVAPPYDVEALAGGIAAAVQESRKQPADWQQRREDARRSIADRFTFDAMASAYEAIWRKVVR
jgi:glycosyltransferase involved in cell wall biosynthesis